MVTGYRLIGMLSIMPPLLVSSKVASQQSKDAIILSFFLAFIGNLVTTWLLTLLPPILEKRGIFGYDINKRGTDAGKIKVPEAAGLAPGVGFLVCFIFSQQLHYYNASYILSNPIDFIFNRPEIPRETMAAWLVNYNAALATVGFMLFLGFVDDVLEVPWRVKLVLPTIASLPISVAYNGARFIAVPTALQWLVGGAAGVDIGILYNIYMVMLTIFCTNSINILAGINGLEAGQSFIIACAVLLFNLLHLSGIREVDDAMLNGHLFSAFMMIPFAACTFALLKVNYYPAKMFVGDTFTYFAGATFAVAGILGHYSEILLIFFIPQLINFAYSLPQLFGLVPCPRHRLPKLDVDSGKLQPTPNYNLVNLFLQLFGQCTEEELCLRLLTFQGLCCVGGIAGYFLVAEVFY